MLIRIALVSTPGVELDKVRAALRNPMRFTLREFLSMEAVIHGLVSFPTDVLLMRIPHFTDHHLVMAGRALRRFHQSTVLVLARDVEPSARMRANRMERFKILQEPHEVADLVAIIDKMQRGESSQHRLHPRARRDGGVQIIDRKGLVHRAHFLDYAQMGARLSLVGNGKLQPKDSVQIVYGSSAEPGKFHKVEAKIIWATETGGLVDQLIGNQQQMAGVRFIAKY